MDLSGRFLSHYKVLEKLGEGGMGVVYKAEDLRLKRIVAVKVLKPELLEDEESKGRFLREAQAAAALGHPNVCTVHEIDEAGGVSFIVMEYVQGVNLKDRITSSPMEISWIIDIAIQIGDALNSAHEKNIIHRDIKPSNILIKEETGVVKVSDFGLAKLIRPEEEGEGGIWGTIEYMSPEQVRGGKLDCRSDIFSFGVVMYEMITGRSPFKENTDGSTIDAVLHKRPLPLARFNSELPWELEAIVRKMMAKDVDERYQTAKEVLIDLRKLKPGYDEKEEKRKQKKSLFKLALLMVVSLSVLAFIALYAWLHFRIDFSKGGWLLISDFENQTNDPVFDRTLNEALQISLAQSSYVNIVPPQWVRDALKRLGKREVKGVDETLGRVICRQEGFKALLAGGINQVEDVYFLTARLVYPNSGSSNAFQQRALGKNEVLPALDKLAIEVRKSLGEPLSSTNETTKELSKMTTSSLQALRYYSQAREHVLIARLKEALPFFESAIRLDPNFAMAYRGLAVAYGDLQDISEARRYISKAFELKDNVTNIERLAIEGEYHYYFGRLEDSVKSYEVLVRVYPDNYAAHVNLGHNYRQLTQFNSAIKQFQEAMRIREDVVPSGIAVTNICLNNYEEAIKYALKAIQTNRQSIWDYRNLGIAYLGKGDSEQARKQFEGLVASDEESRKLGKEGLAYVHIYKGKFADAQREFQEAILLAKGSSLKRWHLAMLFALRGEKSEALIQADEAIRLIEDAPDWVLALVAKLYARMGQVSKAERALSKLEERFHSIEGNQSKSLSNLAQGEILLAKGNTTAAIEAFKLAAAYPILESYLEIHESLATAYRSSRQFEEARKEYEDLLNHQGLGLGGNSIPQHWILVHYWLGKVYEEMNQPDKAAQYYEKFIAIWKEADQDIPLLREAKQRLTRLTGRLALLRLTASPHPVAY